MDPEYVREVYRFAPKPSAAFYFRVPLDEAMRRILAGRPELKFYEAGMDLGLSDDPVKSFQLFQGRILEEYERIIPQFELSVIDATRPIADQQAQVRGHVRPMLTGCLRLPDEPQAGMLRELGVSGRYLRELHARTETV
jgi:dTMP kinase